MSLCWSVGGVSSLVSEPPSLATAPDGQPHQLVHTEPDRTVHNTTLVDGLDCRPMGTYEELLHSGCVTGIRDYLKGPRLKAFSRGADEAGYALLATADRNTLLAVVTEMRNLLTLPAAHEHMAQIAIALLCASPHVCTVHGALCRVLGVGCECRV